MRTIRARTNRTEDATIAEATVVAALEEYVISVAHRANRVYASRARDSLTCKRFVAWHLVFTNEDEMSVHNPPCLRVCAIREVHCRLQVSGDI